NSIVPATIDTGNHCDDCTTPLTFTFPITFYCESQSNAAVSSNGNIQFSVPADYFGADCLPNVDLDTFIMPFQGDLRTAGTAYGIFTDTLGTAPNRKFIIEWRTHYYGIPGTANFEAIF